MERVSISCETCERLWSVNCTLTVYEQQALESRPCPHCGAQVYEEAEQCPRCGAYIVGSTRPFQGRSLAWIILGLLGIVAVVISMFTWLPGM